MNRPFHRISRRGLLAAGAGVAAAPAVHWALRERVPLFTQARGLPAPFLASLVERLEVAFAAAGRPVHIEPVVAAGHAALGRLAQGASGEAFVFAGAGWEHEWLRALPSSVRAWRLSLGAEVDSADERVSSALWQGLELGGAWSAQHLGQRAVVLVSGEQAATDLPLAFRHGLERGGGQVARVVVAHPGRAAEAWTQVLEARPEVVLLSASGAAAASLWAQAPAGLPTVTHAFSGGEGRSHVVHGEAPALDALAALAVARVLGRLAPASPLHLTSPSGRVTPLGLATDATLASRADLTLRNRSTFPFTGC